MKRKKHHQSLIATILTFAMLLSMLPVTAFAATPGGPITEAARKNMRLASFFGREISVYYYGNINADDPGAENTEKQNYFSSETSAGREWMRLSYTIEKSQPVDLVLWRLSDGYGTGSPVKLPYAEDKDENEPFLSGAPIGYLYGIRVKDNIANPDEDEEIVEPKKMEQSWYQIYLDALDGLRNGDLTAMQNQYSYGFSGIKQADVPPLNGVSAPTETPAIPETPNVPEEPVDPKEPADPEQPAEPEQPTDPEQSAEAVDTDDPVTPEEPTTSGESVNPKQPDADADILNEMAQPLPSDIEAEPQNQPEAPEANEPNNQAPGEGNLPVDEPTQVPEPTEEPLPEEAPDIPAASEEIPLPAEEPIYPPVTEADVLFGPSSSTFMTREVQQEDITNYFLWNGEVSLGEGEEPFTPDYSDGRYVIVMTPCYEITKKYNSFLAFDNNTELPLPYASAEEFRELIQIKAKDPVDTWLCASLLDAYAG